MEPATTRVWAEMLSDRKFFNEITSKPPPAAAGWRVWPEGTATPMDARRRRRVCGHGQARTPTWASGARSSGWRRRRRTASASPGLRWSPAGPTRGAWCWRAAPAPRWMSAWSGGRMRAIARRSPSIPLPPATPSFPLKFTAEGGHQRRPLRDCRDRQRLVPHRGRFPDARRQRLGFQGRDRSVC